MELSFISSLLHRLNCLHNWQRFFRFQFKRKKKEQRPPQHQPDHMQAAQQLVQAIAPADFQKLKKEIFKLILSTYYHKQLVSKDKERDLSIYDMARNEQDLYGLNRLSEQRWREIITHMVCTTMDILDYYEDRSLWNEHLKMKVALINIPALRRSTFRLVKMPVGP